MKQGVSDSFNYTCSTGLDVSKNLVPTEVDVACTEDFVSSPLGIRSCPGEPYHSEFFELGTTFNHNSLRTFLYGTEESSVELNRVYGKRHRILFNLYAFDSLHSPRTHTPTLNLYNCDFKYFLDKQALI